jgi:outer membrane protein assembly factor BamD
MSCLSSSSAARRRVHGFAFAVALSVLLPALGGCSSGLTLDSLNPFAKPKELPDQPPEKTYNEGLFLLNEKEDYSRAISRFEEVDREHPYSEWARKSLLMGAYASYKAGDYDKCIDAAKRYISLHPGTADAAYAQYLIGSAEYDQIPDVTRDQGLTEKALNDLEEVVRKYPDTEYAASARKKLAVTRDQLAGKEMEIARFYMKKRDFTGAINRFKVVVTQYQTTREVEEALMRLTEAYMSLGIVDEARTAAAVLGHNFPDSPWYQDAYRLVKSGGLEPAENKASWISKAFKKVGLG